MKVYKSISEVQAKLAIDGIAKNKKNSMQGYNFRGIDDVYNALSKIMPEHNLIIMPRILSRDCVERINHKGTALFYTSVEAEFDFINTEDGSKHTARTFGEAMDSADKSTNKAMSAAYKYACFLTFCIPTEGDNDSENNSHEIDPNRMVVAKTKLTQTQIDAFSEAITKSLNAEELKVSFANAYRFAHSQSDNDAITQITSCYELKKTELGVK